MEGEPRFAHDLLEGRLALRDLGHPVLQLTGHLRTREVRAVDREGVDEGPSCGRRPHRSAAHELSTEQEVEDLMAGGLRAEFGPLPREQEGALRVEGRWAGAVFGAAELLGRRDVAFRKR